MQGVAVSGAEGAQGVDGGSVGFGLMAANGEARIARALKLRGGGAFLWRDEQDLFYAHEAPALGSHGSASFPLQLLGLLELGADPTRVGVHRRAPALSPPPSLPCSTL